MIWDVRFLPEAKADLMALDGSVQKVAAKAISKVSKNPLSILEGGYGKPLGNHNNINLTGCFKIKLKSAGIRIIYKIERIDNVMKIIVIGARSDNEVYELAAKRIERYKQGAI